MDLRRLHAERLYDELLRDICASNGDWTYAIHWRQLTIQASWVTISWQRGWFAEWLAPDLPENGATLAATANLPALQALVDSARHQYNGTLRSDECLASLWKSEILG
eukprot:SM000030S11364  [mRNA]  locus=s30:330343:330905:- [translate_table: standard]